jgi:hypothetical protein
MRAGAHSAAAGACCNDCRGGWLRSTGDVRAEGGLLGAVTFKEIVYIVFAFVASAFAAHGAIARLRSGAVVRDHSTACELSRSVV